MSVYVEFDAATAATVADCLEKQGLIKPAISVWQRLCMSAPYDRRARQRLGDLLLHELAELPPAFAHGTIARSRVILDMITRSMPTEKLRQAYFDNLTAVLEQRTKRAKPGEVVLGVGSGRSGSTTLAAAIGTVPEACATHENPPLINWEPMEEQLRFHFDRMRQLADYYAIVFDASHSWLTSLGRFLAEFPGGKVIGLWRETPACVRSFMNIKGSGRQSANHWAPPGNGIWLTSLADPTYPSYPLVGGVVHDPDATKAALIERYVNDYNHTLRSLTQTVPERFLLIRTEELSTPQTIDRLSDFLGLKVSMPPPLNVASTKDGEDESFRM